VAKGLIYCDMDCFAVQSEGTLLLLDEFGNHVYPPRGLFRVEWLGACSFAHAERNLFIF
jgi:hypothetical protein